MFLTTAEVAERYRTAESTVRYWRMLTPAYGPRCVKVGRRWLYPVDGVEEFERDRAVQAAADRA